MNAQRVAQPTYVRTRSHGTVYGIVTPVTTARGPAPPVVAAQGGVGRRVARAASEPASDDPGVSLSLAPLMTSQELTSRICSVLSRAQPELDWLNLVRPPITAASSTRPTRRSSSFSSSISTTSTASSSGSSHTRLPSYPMASLAGLPRELRTIIIEMLNDDVPAETGAEAVMGRIDNWEERNSRIGKGRIVRGVGRRSIASLGEVSREWAGLVQSVLWRDIDLTSLTTYQLSTFITDFLPRHAVHVRSLSIRQASGPWDSSVAPSSLSSPSFRPSSSSPSETNAAQGYVSRRAMRQDGPQAMREDGPVVASIFVHEWVNPRVSLVEVRQAVLAFIVSKLDNLRNVALDFVDQPREPEYTTIAVNWRGGKAGTGAGRRGSGGGSVSGRDTGPAASAASGPSASQVLGVPRTGGLEDAASRWDMWSMGQAQAVGISNYFYSSRTSVVGLNTGRTSAAPPRLINPAPSPSTFPLRPALPGTTRPSSSTIPTAPSDTDGEGEDDDDEEDGGDVLDVFDGLAYSVGFQPLAGGRVTPDPRSNLSPTSWVLRDALVSMALRQKRGQISSLFVQGSKLTSANEEYLAAWVGEFDRLEGLAFLGVEGPVLKDSSDTASTGRTFGNANAATLTFTAPPHDLNTARVPAPFTPRPLLAAVMSLPNLDFLGTFKTPCLSTPGRQYPWPLTTTAGGGRLKSLAVSLDSYATWRDLADLVGPHSKSLKTLTFLPRHRSLSRHSALFPVSRPLPLPHLTTLTLHTSFLNAKALEAFSDSPVRELGIGDATWVTLDDWIELVDGTLRAYLETVVLLKGCSFEEWMKGYFKRFLERRKIHCVVI